MRAPIGELVVMACVAVTPDQYRRVIESGEIVGHVGPFAVHVNPYVPPGMAYVLNLSLLERLP